MTSKIVSPQILYDRLKDGERIVIIDVMVDDQFRVVHLPGAINVCVYEIIFLDNIARLIPEKDSEIVIYGSSDQSLEEATAAEKLVGAGYRDVSVLQGGLKGWKASGYELEGEDIGIVDRVGPALTSENTWYLVDTGQSIIHWFGRNRNTTHHGTLRLHSGEIGIRDGKIEGTFEIDMTSIRDIDLEGDPLQPNLIAHLMSEDFFFVRLFPKAVFTIRSADQIEEVLSSLPISGYMEFSRCGGLRTTSSSLQQRAPCRKDLSRSRHISTSTEHAGACSTAQAGFLNTSGITWSITP